MKLRLISLIVVMAICFGVKAQIITTVAGDGGQGYNGDSIAAISAELNYPGGTVFDASGNLFIADVFNNRIRKVDITDIISTVAGNGTFGFSGDGGLATLAKLKEPTGLAVDLNGNLYIAELYGNRIRKVTPNGIITTIAGTGTSGFSGDGGPAISAELYYPNAVAVDSIGNIYIADLDNERIRKVDTLGIITTIAGNGISGYSGDGGPADTAELGFPWGIKLDKFGNLFIAETGGNRVRKIDTKGIISTVAGNGTQGFSGDGGSALSAQLAEPRDITIDASGNIYIADWANSVIRKVDSKGIISSIVGDGTLGYNGDSIIATSAQLDLPLVVTLDAFGNLFVTDVNNERIRKITGLVTPVSLSTFTATKQKKNVLLNWQTATETNTSHFNIQSSTNGKDFETVGSVNAKGAGTYSFNDPLTIHDSRFTKLYYRLEIVDKDGSKTYSDIRELTMDNGRLTISPNPAKDIVYIAGKAMQHITIMDNAGKIVVNKTLNSVDNTSINITNLAKGVYFISVKDISGNKQTEKLVVD